MATTTEAARHQERRILDALEGLAGYWVPFHAIQASTGIAVCELMAALGRLAQGKEG